MNNINVDQMLAQMKVMAAQAAGQGQQAQQTRTTDGPGFADMLQSSISEVNKNQMQAGKMAEAFSAGTSDVDLGQVMVSLQKASLQFQTMVQVRNKLVDAYKEVMNMPV